MDISAAVLLICEYHSYLGVNHKLRHANLAHILSHSSLYNIKIFIKL